MPTEETVKENAFYSLALTMPHKLPHRMGALPPDQQHSLGPHLSFAEAASFTTGDDRWIKRCETLGMALVERAFLLGEPEETILDHHVPVLRELFTRCGYVDSVIVPRVTSGNATVANISFLLNEMSGPHKRGPSLIDWGTLTFTERYGMRRRMLGALADFTSVWSGTEIRRRNAPAIAEVALWSQCYPRLPSWVLKGQSKRLLGIIVGRRWGQKVPGNVSRARREAKSLWYWQP